MELDATIVGIGDHQTSGRQPSWLTDLLGTGSHASFEPNVRLRMTEEGSGTHESENDGRTKTKKKWTRREQEYERYTQRNILGTSIVSPLIPLKHFFTHGCQKTPVAWKQKLGHERVPANCDWREYTRFVKDYPTGQLKFVYQNHPVWGYLYLHLCSTFIFQ